MFCDFVDGSNKTVWHYFWYNCTFPETTTAATTEPVTSPPCDCKTACRANLTEEQIQARLQKIKDDLLVDSTKLSATIRKKQSAKDSRPSAVTTGSFGVAIVVLVFGFIISADVISLFQWLSQRFTGGN
ncbi:hypothetical protein V1264_000036 [Littorina saxatilis]|uniref:Uncharacterized protein n=2 Tax=Littorina saxatilis TaxID=31220 RepID=A0AAN9C3N4_9CAEN